MGVTGLWTVLKPCARPHNLEALNRQRLAVDASIWIYQFLKAVRDKEGHALRNSHVIGFFRRICKLLYFGIKPVFVFDGDAPRLKKETIANRKQRREGRREDAVRTAGRLLAVQMQRLAEEEDKKNKETRQRKQHVHAEEKEEEVPQNAVYAAELNMTPTERKQNRKFRREDEYHLPRMDGSLEAMGAPDDPRIMSHQELQEYAHQFNNGEDINLLDFSKIDYDGPFFQSLPVTDKYNILNAARLRSRLRMGYTKEQLEELFPNRMEFSRFQIERVKERNDLTQRLMNINGMVTDESLATGARIAGDRNREYVLVKSNEVHGGWVLGILGGDKGSGKAQNPIDLDEDTEIRLDAQGGRSHESEDEDFEDVPIEGLNRLPESSAANTELFGLQDKMDEFLGRRKPSTRPQSVQYTNNEDSSQRPSFSQSSNEDELFVSQEAFINDGNHDELFVPEDPGIEGLFEEPPLPEAEGPHAAPPAASYEPAVAAGDEHNGIVSDNKDLDSTISGEWPNKEAGRDIKPNKAFNARRVLPGNFSEANEPREYNLAVTKDRKFPEVVIHNDSDEESLISDNTIVDIDDKGKGKESGPSKVYVASEPFLKKTEQKQQESVKSFSETASIHQSISSKQSNFNEMAEEPEPFGSNHPFVQDTTPESAVKRGSTSISTPEPTKEENEPTRPVKIERENDSLFVEQPEDIANVEPHDYVEFSDEEEQKEENDLLQQLKDENAEFVRFTSSLSEAPQKGQTYDFDTEMKHLRSQQAKDRRDADEVTQTMIQECQQLLRFFGIPYITAPMEAEAQCAELLRSGLVDGIVTDDSDTFLFGGTKVFKNVFSERKFVECYLAEDFEKEYGLGREKLISFSHLLGSDYTEGIPNVGPVTAMEIVTEFGSLEEFRDWWTQVQRGAKLPDNIHAAFRKKFRKNISKLFLPPSFPDKRVEHAYLHPEVDPDPSSFQWGVPDLAALRQFLMETVGWSGQRTDEILLPVIRDMNRRQAEGTQSNIPRFFEGQLGLGVFAPRKRANPESQSRMEKAFGRLKKRRQED